VLSGSEPARRRRGPVAVGEVVRAAVEQVREPGRVDLQPAQDLPIVGHAATDVLHLLVELIDNALVFSAPETSALVTGQPLPAGYLIEIQDQGIGMSDELADANHRLADPPTVDLAHVRMLVLFVIGQLAARHSIKVQLRRSRYGGITALVLLPVDLMVQSDPLGARQRAWRTSVAGTHGQSRHDGQALEGPGRDSDWPGGPRPTVPRPRAAASCDDAHAPRLIALAAIGRGRRAS